MTQKNLITLGIVAAALAGAAYFTSSSKKVNAPSLVGKPVLKNIDLSEIARIEAGVKDGKKLVLASTDDGWVIQSLYGYPADISKIRENLLTLKEIKAGHVVSGKKLENPALVDLQNAAGKSLATLSLGEKYFRQSSGEMTQFGGGGYPGGRYVAGDGSDTVVLVKETLDAFDGDPKNWTDSQIAAIASADVTAVELTRDGNTVSLVKKDGAWTLGDLGEKEEFDASKSYGVESALSYLHFNTVADPALTEEQLGMTAGAVFKVILKTGEIYTVKIGQAAEGTSDRYLKINAAFSPADANAAENAAIEKKVADFNAKTGKWTYTVASYSADNMTKTRVDFVKAKEEPKEEEASK